MRKQNKLRIILVLATVSALGIGCTKQTEAVKPVADRRTESGQSTEIIKEVINNSQEWKTYANARYGYKIFYPPESKFVGSNDQFISSVASDKTGGVILRGDKGTITIVGHTASDIADVYNLANTTSEKVTFGKNTFTQIKRGNAAPPSGYYGDYVIGNGNNIIIIILTNIDAPETAENILKLFEYPYKI